MLEPGYTHMQVYLRSQDERITIAPIIAVDSSSFFIVYTFGYSVFQILCQRGGDTTRKIIRFTKSASMKKAINIGLLLASLIGFLEWGRQNSTFLFQAEWSLLSNAVTKSSAFLHPLVIVPLLRQLLLLFTIFQQKPSRVLSILGLLCLSIIMLFILFVGIISTNVKIVLSTLPFVLLGIVFVVSSRRNKPIKNT